MKRKPPLVLIAGPTASGKSALALDLAEQKDGVIVNADSAQVYRDLPILSAAPDETDRARADHRLYGSFDGATPCSAAGWAAQAKLQIHAIRQSGMVPILVGGTGLYLRTLIDGIAPVPEIAPDIRSAVRSATVEDNWKRLRSLDAEAAGRLDPGDTSRIARALEVVLSTGRTLRDWQSNREGGIGALVELSPLVLLPPRDWLYRRCDARFEAMIDRGAIAEVEALLGRGLDPSLPVMRAIGVREIAAFLGGQLQLDEMIERGKQATRNYAKRQYTWFAHQPPADWPRFDRAPEGPAAADALALVEARA